jgi:pimeloyl-ACP methyl ester carboxylesterase
MISIANALQWPEYTIATVRALVSPAAGRARRILLRVVFYSVAILVGLPLVFSHVMTRTFRRPPSGSPPPGWTEVRLAADGLRLRAWTAPGQGDRAAVVVAHGVGDSLESFTDVGRALGQRGHPVLLLDLRGHGGSEGDLTTLGGRESRDVLAALDHLRGRKDAARGAILMGFSMGAVAALLAAPGREDVRAVIVEAPYDTYRDTVRHHAWLLYRMPRWLPVVPLSIAAAEWRAGFDADEVDAVAAARRIRAPLLAIVDGEDARMPEAVVRRVFEAHPGPRRLWIAPGAGHVGASLHPDYWPVVLRFLEENGL